MPAAGPACRRGPSARSLPTLADGDDRQAGRDDEDRIVKVDQAAQPRNAGLSMATRLCGLLSKRVEFRTRKALHRKPGRASPRQRRSKTNFATSSVATTSSSTSATCGIDRRLGCERPIGRNRAPKGRDSKAQVGAQRRPGIRGRRPFRSVRSPNGARQLPQVRRPHRPAVNARNLVARRDTVGTTSIG